MTKTDLIKKVSTGTGKPIREVTELIDCFFKELSEGLRSEDISLKDFGSFKKIVQKERIAHNPATRELITVPEKEVVKFKPSKNILKMKWL